MAQAGDLNAASASWEHEEYTDSPHAPTCEQCGRRYWPEADGAGLVCPGCEVMEHAYLPQEAAGLAERPTDAAMDPRTRLTRPWRSLVRWLAGGPW